MTSGAAGTNTTIDIEPVTIMDAVPFTGVDLGGLHLSPIAMQSVAPVLGAAISIALIAVLLRARRTWIRRSTVAASVVGYLLCTALLLLTVTMPTWAISPDDAKIIALHQVADRVEQVSGWQVLVPDLPLNESERPVWARPSTTGTPVQCRAADTDTSEHTITLKLTCPVGAAGTKE